MKTIEWPRELSIAWLRDAYTSKMAAPEAVVEEIVRRSKRDAGMNIWITPPSMELAGPYIKRLQNVNPDEAPLWGIPFAVKDNIDLAGIPTTAGCPDFTYTPDKHSAVVERLIAAGAIPVGKTNLDQFATGLVGTRSPYGETHNAWRGELISGGSSSGSAVAVARGHAAFALGTDTAGSGRVPAALNRLVGYKPSLGAWPLTGIVPACASLDCVTVFSGFLEDALAVDRVARGPEPTDPWSRSLPASRGGVPAKLLLPKDTPAFFGPFAGEYKRAWKSAVERLKGLNMPVEYVDTLLFERAAALLYDGPFVAERWAGLGRFIREHPGAALPVTEQIVRSGAQSRYTASSLFEAMHELQKHKKAAGELLAHAVLVMPTTGGTWTREQVRLDPIAANSAMGRYTNHCNLLDLCAVAVPADDAAGRLPFGITFFSQAANENLICSAARSFLRPLEQQGHEPVPSVQNAETEAGATTLLAVCGLHMRGYPLEKQLLGCGAKFVREAKTSAKYELVKLPTVPAKPGLIKTRTGGASIELELWEMPLRQFGSFAAGIPAPLGIGKVELEDGEEVPGFVCEGYAADEADNITVFGGWRKLDLCKAN